MRKYLLFFIAPALLSFTSVNNNLSNKVSGEDSLNYFKNESTNSAINNSVWYETPTFKKEITSESNYESFATKELAKETMIKALNKELNYEVEGQKVHWFNATYTKTTGFSSIFNGTNKYQTYFAVSQNWIVLEEGIDKVQQLNKQDINEYEFGPDGTSYQVCIMPEFTNHGYVATKKVYVFVYKDLTNDVINPNFEIQINSFINKQAENLIIEKNVFGNDQTRCFPAPLFKDSEIAPESNPVFSNLIKVESKNSNEIQTEDGTYYNHAFYNEENGLESFNYETKIKPTHSSINSRELCSLTSSINSGIKTYNHYICEESSSDQRSEDWAKLITCKSDKYPLFQNVLSNIVNGTIKDYVLDLNNEYFKGFEAGDIKLNFATNDKVWVKVTIEHADFPEVIENTELYSTCNWDLSDKKFISSNGFNFSSYPLPLLNAKYTFHSVDSLGDYNSFSFNIENAPKEAGSIIFLDSSMKKANDTFLFNEKDIKTSYFDLDVNVPSQSATQSNIAVKDINGEIEISLTDISKENAIVGKKIHVTPKENFSQNQVATFTIYYPGTQIEKKCTYFINKIVDEDFSKVEALDFKSSGGNVKFDKSTHLLSAINDVAFAVPATQYEIIDVGNKKVVYEISYRVLIEGKEQEYKTGDTVSFGPGNYKTTLRKIIIEGEGNNSSYEDKTFTVTVTKNSSKAGGLHPAALAAIIAVPCLLVVIVILLIVKVRKGQSLKENK